MIWLFDIIMLVVDVHLKYVGVYLCSFKYLNNKMSLLVQMFNKYQDENRKLDLMFKLELVYF